MLSFDQLLQNTKESGGCRVKEQPNQARQRIPIKIVIKKRAIEILAEVADTDTKRTRGLMFRHNLNKDTGMLFVYPEDIREGFWMKNTLIPLDILYVGSNKRIIGLCSMTPVENPRRGPWPSYNPGLPYRYAIEVNSGFARQHNINVGDCIVFNDRQKEEQP